MNLKNEFGRAARLIREDAECRSVAYTQQRPLDPADAGEKIEMICESDSYGASEYPNYYEIQRKESARRAQETQSAYETALQRDAESRAQETQAAYEAEVQSDSEQSAHQRVDGIRQNDLRDVGEVSWWQVAEEQTAFETGSVPWLAGTQIFRFMLIETIEAPTLD